jgi:hypothetical protein
VSAIRFACEKPLSLGLCANETSLHWGCARRHASPRGPVHTNAQLPKERAVGPPQMADNLLFLARSLRSRAAEILLKIEIMTDADALAQMREIAARYVR